MRDLYWAETSHHQKFVNKRIMLWLLQFVPMVPYLHIYCFLKTDLYCYVLTILFFRTYLLESHIINLNLFPWDTSYRYSFKSSFYFPFSFKSHFKYKFSMICYFSPTQAPSPIKETVFLLFLAKAASTYLEIPSI